MTSPRPAQLPATNAPALSAWRQATVVSIEHPNAHAAILRLQIPHRVQHLPGQHYVIRLSAPDGYVAQRSYSVASPPTDPLVEFYIDRLPDGEVSTFLVDILEPGDKLDVRGPIGGWFVWDGTTPLLGLAGGSGVVPFIAMRRHAVDLGTAHLLLLAVSARTRTELPYAEQIETSAALITFTQDNMSGPSPGARTPRSGRFDAVDLALLLHDGQRHYVCGSTSFSGAAVTWLQKLGVSADTIRVESFGPSG